MTEKDYIDACEYAKERNIELITLTEDDYYMGIPITYKSFYWKLFTKHSEQLHEKLINEFNLNIPMEYIRTCFFRALEIKPKYK